MSQQNYKLGVCVPYRNREEHLNKFLPKISNYLESKGIDYSIYFAHQADDKLFNRGTMKNIAAEWAFKEGCDYIVWHDIDMVPEDNSCDYSYPHNHPIHIATNISQMNYGLKYYEYFGGAVLFTKEQVYKTNGYSNNYWDWGMEDDDLFWRCVMEGYANEDYLSVDLHKQRYVKLNGDNSAIVYPYSPKLKNLTQNSHTFSILARIFQQPDKNPIYLIGDENKKYVEYPIMVLSGYDYGIHFNNSRAISFQFWDKNYKHNYMWLKRYDRQWSWITVSVDTESKEVSMYLNGKEANHLEGHGSKSPHSYFDELANYVSHLYIGVSNSLKDGNPRKYLKGDIAKFYVWNRSLTPYEVSNLHNTIPLDGNIVNVDFNNDYSDIYYVNTEYEKETIQIPNYIIPHRISGKFKCLPHEDLGLTKDGNWKQGKTTAKNEERYVLETQQGKSDYKNDGMNTLKYQLISVDDITSKAKMINVKL
jgi:hypothetical protein